jgi:hypothetical protein
MPRIHRQEWLLALTLSLIILIISGLPFLYGGLAAAPGQRFSGFVIGLEDGNSYLAKMQQGRSGYWLFRLAYTPEPHRAEPFFIFYISLGKIAGMLNLPNPLMLHLSRLVTIPFGLLAFYYFSAYFIDRIRVRQLALLIFGLTGGLGWLWVALGGSSELGRMPVDLWVPDASFFLTTLAFPHLPLAQGLLLLFSLFGLEFVRRGRSGVGVAAAGCGLVISLIHPHTVPVMTVILGLYILWQSYTRKKLLLSWLLRLGLIILPALPYLSYVLVVFNRNPAFVAWRNQSLTYSPAPLHYLLGFGITFVCALLGLSLTWRGADSKYRFLHIWTLSVPLLVYLPIALQRRFLDGYQAPLVVLATIGLVWLVQKIPNPRWQFRLVAASLVLMSLTNVLLLGGALMTIARRSNAVFLPRSEVEAAQWLATTTRQNVVLAAYQTGNYLPTVADVRSFVGHGPETVEADRKNSLVTEFFSGGDDHFRRQLLNDYEVNFLYYGPAERALGDFSPGAAPYLERVYDNGSVQIYRVVAPGDD